MVSYGRLTSKFRTDVFTHTRWLFSYGATFLPDARGNMLFYEMEYQLFGVCCMCQLLLNFLAYVHVSSFVICFEFPQKLCVLPF